MSHTLQAEIWHTDIVHGGLDANKQVTSIAVIRLKPGSPRLVVFSQVSRLFTGTDQIT